MGLVGRLMCVRDHAGLGTPGLEPTPKREGAHGSDHGLESLKNLPWRRAFIERDRM